MQPHRLRAPSQDGALLAEPPLEEAAAVLADATGRLGRWDYDFQGRRSGRLRALARKQTLEKAREYLNRFGLDVPQPPGGDAPLIVTGHQPELFHAGVWVKNFATAALSRAQGGVGLNLIVDNDIPKASSIRVPARAGDALKVQRVEFDEWGGEVPYEDLDVSDEARFASFGERVRSTLHETIAQPLIESYWPLVLERRGQTSRVGLRFAAARRALEARLGIHNFEVPLSAVCETEAFLWFASHILAQLPRFQEVHNSALARYRVLYGIRSRHHPVPALGQQGDWLEAPFWAWRAGQPRRQPLLVRQHAQTMELRIGGENETLIELPLAPDREACCAVERLQSLPARQVRLRTRALTTTMFARLLLGDLFLHGIGGAKYDELGDEIIRGFFGLAVPPYLTLSLTLWLDLHPAPAARERLDRLDRTLRDLTYNPDRHLDPPIPPDAQAALDAKRQALAAPVDTRTQRLDRFHTLRRINESLQPWVEPQRRRLIHDRTSLRADLQRNQVACSRDYSFVLHSEGRIREAMASTMAKAAVGSGRSEKIA